MPFDMGKSKSKKGIQYRTNSPYLTEVQWDRSDLSFVHNKDYQYKVSHFNIWREVELKASILSV